MNTILEKFKKRPKTIRIGPGPIESFVDRLLDLVLGEGRGTDNKVPLKADDEVRPGRPNTPKR